MDALLCDELLQDIFHRLPPSASPAVSLVSKRWLRLLRSSTTSLSIHFPPSYNSTAIASLSHFLTQHPFLSSLTLAGAAEKSLIAAVASSCPNLRRFSFLSSQVSPVSLYTLSIYCDRLDSIAVTVSRPLPLSCLRYFTSLKSLTLSIANPCPEVVSSYPELNEFGEDCGFDDLGMNSNLETLALSGISAGDSELACLWRNCNAVTKLQLMNCDSLGDYSGFAKILPCLKEVELRTCRAIIDVVLIQLSDSAVSLDSLLVHDGGNGRALLHFINHAKCSLTKLDLRLPLDLDNTHLIALSENLNFRGLTTLRLQSCSFVTGDGLKILTRVLGDMLEELALINCDVVGREHGLLSVLGQCLNKLRKLDLSYNDTLMDMELVSMLASCNDLVELKLRGCNRLSDMTISLMVRNCKQLQDIDMASCSGIRVQGVEFLVMNSARLRRLEIEHTKMSEAATIWASNKLVQVISSR